MAIVNEIQVGRYNRFVQKLLSMKGPATLNQASPELGFAIAPFHGVENRYLEGWDVFGFGFAVSAHAGDNAVVTIRNPAGSNVAAVLESVVYSAIPVDQPNLIYFPPGSAGALVSQTNIRTARSLDARGRPSSTCIVSDSSGVAIVAQAGGQAIAGINAAANTAVDMIRSSIEIPLLPGASYTCSGNNVNQAAQITLLWRERFLEDSERS